MPDLNCDPASAVLHAGPQLRSRECSVACRTSTAIPRVQCCVPDLNRDPVRAVKEVAWYAVFEACSSEFEKWHFDVFDESLKHQNEHFVQGFLHF